MKTRGLEVVCGYLVGFEADRAIPRQFWHRLKAELSRRHLLDEFAADYRAEKAAVHAQWAESVAYSTRAEDWAREERLFRRWVERVVGPQAIWPWERGWTEELVDSYLEPVEAKREAA